MPEDQRPDPITAEDITGLRVDFRGLTHSVDNLAARQKVTDEAVKKKADQTTVDRLNELEEGRRSNRKRATVAIVLAFVVFAAVIGTLVWSVRSNGDRIDAQNADRRDRSRGSCIQFNVQQDRDREAIVRGVIDGLKPVVTSEEGAQFLEAFEPSLRVSVVAQLPYRDCSQAGIDAFLQNPPPDPNGG